MPRVKRSVVARKRRRRVLRQARGYYSARGRHFRAAREQLMHSGVYAFRDRRARKGDFRRLWIARINAAARANGMTYSRLMAGLRVAGASLVVVLADVRDPGNAGTLVRWAAAAGADAIVFCSGAVDALHPKTVRSAAGSLWRLPVVRDVSLPDCAAELRAAGLVVVGADASAPRQLYDADLTRRLGLVLGNESWGISGEAGAPLDEGGSVPLQPGGDSLHVAGGRSGILF